MEERKIDLQLFKEGGMTIREPDSGYVGLVNIVTGRTGHVPFLADPVFFHLHLPPTLEDRVAGQLAHVGRGEFVNLRSARVFFEQVRGGKVEL